MNDRPSIEYLRTALILDSDTGILTWKLRSDMPRNWNTRYAGSVALNADKGQGYRSGTVLGKRLLAHRVVWALHYGEWPEGEIDHINGIGSDNRIENLRLASRAQNCRNINGRRHGRVCFKGVYWFPRLSKYVAKIRGAIGTEHLGYFENECEAANAYDLRALQLFGEFARTNLSMDLYNNPQRVSVRRSCGDDFEDIL